MFKKNKFFGYLMTEKQAQELSELLTENILERYNYPAYYEPNIIEEYATEHRLKKVD